MDVLLKTLKFVHEMSVGVMNFIVVVHNWFVSSRYFSAIDFYNNSVM